MQLTAGSASSRRSRRLKSSSSSASLTTPVLRHPPPLASSSCDSRAGDVPARLLCMFDTPHDPAGPHRAPGAEAALRSAVDRQLSAARPARIPGVPSDLRCPPAGLILSRRSDPALQVLSGQTWLVERDSFLPVTGWCAPDLFRCCLLAVAIREMQTFFHPFLLC